MDNLTWLGFKELISNRFTPKYQNIRDGVALVRLKQTKSLRGYVWEFNAHLNVRPKMDELAKKGHLLQWLAKLSGMCIV